MAEEYTLDFETYGSDLPVDSILAVAHPTCPFEVWRVGDMVTGGRISKSSGLRITIASRVGKHEAERTLLRFLSDESDFLGHLEAFRAHVEEQFVRCIMCVYPDNASYFELSLPLLAELRKTGTEFVVAAWPCDHSKEEKPSGAPEA